jgi:hypothetical protein
MATTFITSEYENSHGITPRGRGGWMFIDADEYDPRRELPWDKVVTACGTYTEAKQQIRKSELRGAYVVVLP